MHLNIEGLNESVIGLVSIVPLPVFLRGIESSRTLFVLGEIFIISDLISDLVYKCVLKHV